MRHGRKSKSKRFDGYKEHIARDLDMPVILACAVTPRIDLKRREPNRSAMTSKLRDSPSTELHIDRAYVNSPVVDEHPRSGRQHSRQAMGTTREGARNVHEARLQDRSSRPHDH